MSHFDGESPDGTALAAGFEESCPTMATGTSTAHAKANVRLTNFKTREFMRFSSENQTELPIKIRVHVSICTSSCPFINFVLPIYQLGVLTGVRTAITKLPYAEVGEHKFFNELPPKSTHR